MSADPSPAIDGGARAASRTGAEKAAVVDRTLLDAIRFGEERYRALADSVPHGIVEVDRQFTVVATNPAFRRLVGCTDQFMLGTVWWDHLADVQDLQSRRWLERCLSEGDATARTFFHRLKGAAGYDVDVRADWSIRRDAGGGVIGYTAVITDLTAINAAEARRRTLEAEFAQRQRLEAVGTLASGIAHDVNNQLLPVLALSSLLLDEVPEDATLRADIKTIFEAAGRASALIRDLQELSRLGAAPAVVVDLGAIATAALDRLKSRLPRHINVSSVLGSAPRILAAPQRLEQAIASILGLAVETIADREGEIRITLDTLDAPPSDNPDAARWSLERGPWARLVIADNGPGIDAQTRRHLFEPLASGKAIGPDAGLGLAVAHRVVTRLGGTITCISQPGQGTTFTLLLPAAPVAAAEPQSTLSA